MPLSKKCFECKTKFNIFRLRYSCESPECGRTFCSKCVCKFDNYSLYLLDKPTDAYGYNYLCHDCWQIKISPFHNRYVEVSNKPHLIECFPATYKGNIQLDKTVAPMYIESKYHKVREDALLQVRVTAFTKGFNVVYDCKYQKETRSKPSKEGDGTYYYSMWRAIGFAGKLKES